MVESRFTRESAFCPHPEYWHSPDSEATEGEITEFIGSLVRAIQPEFVVETGTYHGYTALEIGKALYANGHGYLISIEKDPEIHKVAESWRQNDWSFLPVTMLNMNSIHYEPDRDIDFAFFDSWQEGRAEEFMRFHQMGRLKKDAIVVFHDTAPHHQVWKYVESLEVLGLVKLITIHSPRGLTIGQVIK